MEKQNEYSRRYEVKKVDYRNINGSEYRTLIPYKKKRKNIKKVVKFWIISLILIIVLIVLLFNFVFVSPRTVFERVVGEIRNNISSGRIIQDTGSLKLDLDISAKIDDKNAKSKLIDTNISDIINNLKINLKVEKNINGLEMLTNLKMQTESNSFNIDAIITEKMLYLNLKEIFDKYICVNFDKDLSSDFFYLSKNKYINALDKSLKQFSDSLKDEYFRKDEDGKNTLILNDNNIKEILTYILENLIEDPEFLNVLAEIMGLNTPEIKAKIDAYIVNIKSRNIIDKDTVYEISLYKEGLFKIAKVSLDEIKVNKVINSISFGFNPENEIDYKIVNSDDIYAGKIILEKDEEKSRIAFEIDSNKYGKFNISAAYNISYSENEITKPNIENFVSLQDLSISNTSDIINKVKEQKNIYDLIHYLYKDFKVEEVTKAYEEQDNNIGNEEVEKKEENTNSKVAELSTNSIKSGETIIEFKVPQGFKLDTKYSMESYKYFDSSDNSIQIYISFSNKNEKEYFNNVRKYDYEYKKEGEDNFYSNVTLSEVKELKISNDIVFKYLKLNYVAGTNVKYEKIFAIYEIDKKNSYQIEIEAKNSTILEEVLKSFSSITVK